MKIYEYEGKTYIEYENTTLEVVVSKEEVESNKKKYTQLIKSIKGEIENA